MPLRSVLFVPGHDARAWHEAEATGADVIVLDLEDFVPEADKAAARERVRAALAERAGRFVAVRVNGFETPLTAGDIEAVARPGLAAVLLPKARDAEDVVALEWLIAAAESRGGVAAGDIRIIPVIETCGGVLAAESIAGASPRNLSLAIGVGDLGIDLDPLAVRREGVRADLGFARARVGFAARAAGLAGALDGPLLGGSGGGEAFERECHFARGLGFLGKVCRDRAQVEIANRVFAPDADEVAHCRHLLGAGTGGTMAAKAEFIGALSDGIAEREAREHG